MLILSRRNSEAIIIGNNITVTVLQIKGHHVRLGIDAPKEVSIHREEVYLKITEERKPEDVSENP